MSQTTPLRQIRILGTLILIVGLAFSQTTLRSRTLTIKGYTGQASVVQINGKSYVEIESLARLTNGTLSFQANQTTLTMPAPSAPVTPANADPAQPDQAGKTALSKDFLRAALEGLTVIREWQAALVNAIHSNQRLTDDWAATYRRSVEAKLALASSAAVKDSDRDAVPFFGNELNNMQRLSDKYLALQNRSRTYVAPESIDNDSLDQQVQTCAAGLTAMASSGHFQDVATCH